PPHVSPPASTPVEPTPLPVRPDQMNPRAKADIDRQAALRSRDQVPIQRSLSKAELGTSASGPGASGWELRPMLNARVAAEAARIVPVTQSRRSWLNAVARTFTREARPLGGERFN